MGIRLDWEIEAEQNTFRVGEDPNGARLRRRARLRLVLLVALLLALFALGAALVNLRLRDLAQRDEQFLRDVVDAEIANLRLGNFEAFLGLQRSADSVWMAGRRTLFDEYQTLIQASDVQLTGVIRALTIDGLRARVHVEEIIDGVPYERIWFYFRYPDDGPDDDDNDARPFNDAVEQDEQTDGWRHVPPDYTFWGDTQTLETGALRVTYRAVDSRFAQAVSAAFTDWLTLACEALVCSGIPPIQIEVVPAENVSLAWPLGTWTIVMPSPYVVRGRSDLPFSPELQIQAAQLMAEQLITYASAGMLPPERTDAAYLRQAIVSWLIGQFVLIDTQSYLMSTVAANFGAGVIGQVAATLRPETTLDVLRVTTGQTSVADMGLDWRDYFGWRLALEAAFLAEGQRESYLALYDTRDPDVLTAAYARFDQAMVQAVTGEEVLVVSAQQTAPSVDGAPQQLASVQVRASTTGEFLREGTVLFRLSEGQWLRAN